jgi:hypothetical protein
VTVTFAPTAVGFRMGDILVETNDVSEAMVPVPVSGTGAESNLSMATPPPFGNVPVALTGGSVQNLTITNNGGISLNTTTMTISGDPSFSFAFASGQCQNGTSCTRVVTAAASGGTAVIPIRCDPSSPGPKMATVNIQSDDPLPMAGTDVVISCTGTVSSMSVSPPSLAFANQRINTSSTSQPIMVSNAAGLAPLNYAVVPPATDFIVTVGAVTCTTGGGNPCANLTVPAGMSATVNVVFRPATTGLKNAVVAIDDRDNFQTDVNVAVSGTDWL